MNSYRFPGYCLFLENAANQIGHPEAAGPARKIRALSALGNLCGQAGAAASAHVPGILAKAAEFQDQLHAASKAADLMLADVQSARGLQQDLPPAKPSARRRAETPET